MPNDKITDQKIRVMVVDDTDSIVGQFSDELKSRLSIAKVQEGRDCLEVAAIHKPEVVLIQLMLGYMDSMEVCQAIRKDAIHSGTRIYIIANTGFRDSIRKAGMLSGADEVLFLPMTEKLMSNLIVNSNVSEIKK